MLLLSTEEIPGQFTEYDLETESIEYKQYFHYLIYMNVLINM